jgi:hypothetical protein
MLQSRRSEAAAIETAAQRQAVAAGAEEAPHVGCFGKFVTCTLFKQGATRVATREDAAAVGVRMESAAQSGLLNRLVGVRKKGAAEGEKLEVATQSVVVRVSSLREKVDAARKRAVAAKKMGRNEEALREMKKLKAVEKQLLTAQAALDALERQADLMAESQLQKELTTALQTTTQSVKAKSKGVLQSAEVAIDDAHEVRDDVQDIAQVFEGLTPDDGHDEGELQAELDAMMGAAPSPASAPSCGACSASRTSSSHAEPSVCAAHAFPSVPVVDAREQRMALLSGQVA